MARTVLHVAAPIDGGVPRYVAMLAREQLDRGWDVTVASPARGDLERLLEGSGARLVDWTAERQPGRSAAGEAVRLARIVRDVDPELVHLHSAKAGLAGRLAVRGRRPTIFTPHAWSFEAAHGALSSAAVAWERFAARWTDVILCVSEAERKRGEEILGVECHVVRTGVDVEEFPEGSDADRRASRTRLGLNGAPVAVCVGRLCEQKGQDLLLRAWPTVLDRVPDAELVLVGEGPDRDRLEALLGPGVKLAGHREDVVDWISAADVVVQPSRWEALSIVMLEAMACGRSLVMTEVDGAREVMDGTGAIVGVDDAAAIAHAVAERLGDPELRAAEGRKARARIEALHTLGRAADAMEALYAEVLGYDTGTLPPLPVSARAATHRTEEALGARS